MTFSSFLNLLLTFFFFSIFFLMLPQGFLPQRSRGTRRRVAPLTSGSGLIPSNAIRPATST